MKKLILLMAVILLYSFSSICFAEELGIKVQLNGEYLDFTDEQGNKVEPQLISNRTMVPLRKIFESLDCTIDWEQETKTVTAKSEGKEIILQIDNDIAIVKESGEEKEIVLDQVPVIVENRTLVPVRFIAESLEKEVSWVQDKKIVVIIDYNKVLKEFENRAPGLEYLFRLKLGDINSFKSTSKISGTLDYEDKDDKTKYETINLAGTVDMLASGNDMQIDISLTYTGKNSSILDSMKEAGTDKAKYRILIKDGKTSIGTYNGKKYEWLDEELETSDLGLGIFSTSTNVSLGDVKFESYSDFLEYIKQVVGETNESTYAGYMSMFDLLGSIFSNDNIKYSESGSKTTFTMEADLLKALEQMLPNLQDMVSDSLDLKVSSKLTLSKGVLKEEVTNLDFKFNATDTVETFKIKAKIETTYSDINKEVKIADK